MPMDGLLLLAFRRLLFKCLLVYCLSLAWLIETFEALILRTRLAMIYTLNLYITKLA